MPHRNTKRLSLAGVISKIRTIAENQYDSKVYDNVMAIFNQLSTAEKRVLLRGLIGMVLMIEEKINENTHHGDETEDDREHDVVIRKDKDALKPWTLKLGGAVLIIGLIVVSTSSFFLTGENGIIARLAKITEVVKHMF